ncbi:MAG: hypothetical protein AAGD25_06930 [Cyanobacteria bacterium P01_F01_bin.150]
MSKLVDSYLSFLDDCSDNATERVWLAIKTFGAFMLICANVIPLIATPPDHWFAFFAGVFFALVCGELLFKTSKVFGNGISERQSQ